MRSSGARITKKRELILKTLLRFDRPATAEEIREKARLSPSDLVTVYRNLETFESIEAVQKIPLENGTHVFELTAPGEHYHHLICRLCKKAEKLGICISKDVLEKAKSKGFTDVDHILEVYGVCSECEQP